MLKNGAKETVLKTLQKESTEEQGRTELKNSIEEQNQKRLCQRTVPENGAESQCTTHRGAATHPLVPDVGPLPVETVESLLQPILFGEVHRALGLGVLVKLISLLHSVVEDPVVQVLCTGPRPHDPTLISRPSRLWRPERVFDWCA